MSTQELLQAIQAFHTDKSRTQAQTRQGLEEAASLIELLMEALDADQGEDWVASEAEQ